VTIQDDARAAVAVWEAAGAPVVGHDQDKRRGETRQAAADLDAPSVALEIYKLVTYWTAQARMDASDAAKREVMHERIAARSALRASLASQMRELRIEAGLTEIAMARLIGCPYNTLHAILARDGDTYSAATLTEMLETARVRIGVITKAAAPAGSKA
jgi:hypothetical protein